MFILAALWSVVAIVVGLAGPFAIVAWVIAWLPWVAIDSWRDPEARDGDGIWFVGTLLCVAAQVALDRLWPHVGDVCFVALSFIVLTSRIRASAFPKARARRTRCSNG